MLDERCPDNLRQACEDVGSRGWQRVIMLGDDVCQGPYSLKACLAQTGVMVFTPGPGNSAWLNELAAREPREVDAASLAQLGSLLADGMEHGVQALVVTDARIGALARLPLPDVPMLMMGEMGNDSGHSAT